MAIKVNLILPKDVPYKNSGGKSLFRELKPEAWWSGFVSVKDSNKEDFIKKLEALAKELNFNFSGWIVDKQDGSFDYFFTRYPRKKYGPLAELIEHDKVLERLARETNGDPDIEDYSDSSKFRIVLGLRELYETSNKLHTIEEVRTELGNSFDLTQAEICAVRPAGKYTEPAVVITGDLSQVEKVYLLAEKFNQARFTVEDLSHDVSYVVETIHCKDPDKE
ncbi:MAG: hypothetical protein HY094_10500 [Candidatus Melainabacteria bacterium]|nr:hypothetical protein [Candidatus Melainabacteria bacterium]